MGNRVTQVKLKAAREKMDGLLKLADAHQHNPILVDRFLTQAVEQEALAKKLHSRLYGTNPLY